MRNISNMYMLNVISNRKSIFLKENEVHFQNFSITITYFLIFVSILNIEVNESVKAGVYHA